MSRSLVLIVLLTLSLFDPHVVKSFGWKCKDLSGFVNSLFLFPKSVDFYVYKNAYTRPQKFTCDWNCNLRNLQFNPYIRTTVIIHGFLSDYKTVWVQTLMHHLFMWDNMNIIILDWSETANVNYYKTARRVGSVALQLHKFLKQIARQVNMNLGDWPYLHFIGHSLGAHVAGEAAVLLRYNVFVHRITALDPAKPYFDGEGAHMKLKKWSAQFIDVIHTNSAHGEETFGLFEPLGHLDFYPNGGDRQPNCMANTPNFRSLSRDCLSELIFGDNYIGLKDNYLRRKLRGNDMICDHGEAPNYFISTILGRSTFIAKKVESNSDSSITRCLDENCIGRGCITMGMNSFVYNDFRYHGIYYANTQCNYRYRPY